MSNGSLFLEKLNSILLYTSDYLRYLDTNNKYTFRDITFREGSSKFLDVITNIDITTNEKTSLLLSIENLDLSHLDLPVNYKQLIEDTIPVEEHNYMKQVKYEFSQQKLSKSFLEFIEYIKENGYDYSKFRLTDFINDLGNNRSADDVIIFNSISDVINNKNAIVKLTNISKYNSNFITEFNTYITNLTTLKDYLFELYNNSSDSYKPNNLPYITFI